MFGQLGGGQRLTDRVVTDVCDLAQTVEQAECKKDAGIDADADARIPRLDPLQCRPGCEGAFGDDRHGQPPTPTGVVDIGPEFAQRAPNGGWRIVWCGHMTPSHYKFA